MQIARFSAKKKLSPFLIVLGLVIAAAVILLLWLSVRDKSPVTAEEFTSAVQARGLSCTEIMAETSQMADIPVQALAARAGSYQLEYYQMADGSAAMRLFGACKNAFEGEKGLVSSHSTVTLGSYASYSLTTNGSYYHVTCIQDTVILAVAGESAKAEVREILDALGY